MNFLSTFLKLSLVLFLIALFGFYGGREIWLFVAAEQVVTDAKHLTYPKQWEDVISGCSSSTITGSSPFEGFQLRFIDQENYALEVDCTAVQPVAKESTTLPQGVKKTVGSAGFYYDFDLQALSGEIQLEFLGRTRVVYADGETVKQTWGTTTFVASQPASACQAFGLTCCDPVEQQGVGEAVSAGVVDCSQNCFSQCLQRPTLLSFTADPTPNHETRTVSVEGTSSLVIFSYAFDETQAEVESVTIQFGDGTTRTLEDANSLVTKEYACPQRGCVYAATVKAVDVRGVESAESRLSTMVIEFAP
ncbi:hypothetical protein LRY65_00160 [Candidatus Woesebacteria bacterium]|nr:hypothetical protein [Candidatus Woesebacteria bacterium]MCD8507246.1 hypothetical protein [Candidatus Woesebacteria bacterium]MCD8526619.1 hypothetical protein [Candidatus Woesebacteria bacterium]MCD8546015.1 hypothetical protein [Candidatus Woesebacteria bacterium]